MALLLFIAQELEFELLEEELVLVEELHLHIPVARKLQMLLCRLMRLLESCYPVNRGSGRYISA